jgi:FKBP-type peptidyl-prolyl cis-trans isomerase FkpA
MYRILKQGTGEKPSPGSILTVTYKGVFLNKAWRFSSSSDRGKPSLIEKPESFTFQVGTDKIIPGLDEALRTMRKGEKRLLILLSDMAYGNSGFYSKEKKGTRRFVIPPNTTLVYEVEVVNIQGPD